MSVENSRRGLAYWVALLAAVILALTLGLSNRQAQGQAPPQQAQQQPQQPQPLFAGLPDLVGALKATPGCLGVELARTVSGKRVIFAWFEDKKAVLRWYYSDTHQQVVNMLAPGAPRRGPLVGVPDDVGPIMAIASLTPSEKPQFAGISMPISQISIELYKPITGGLFLGGRFAPASLKIPGMTDYTPGDKEKK